MNTTSAQSSETEDECLNVLGYEQCRFVLHYFGYHSTEVATIDDLSAFVRDQTQQAEDAPRTRTRLRHVTLPRLADAGVLEYDERSQTARYRGHPTLEAWVNHVVERGEVPDVPA